MALTLGQTDVKARREMLKTLSFYMATAKLDCHGLSFHSA